MYCAAFVAEPPSYTSFFVRKEQTLHLEVLIIPISEIIELIGVGIIVVTVIQGLYTLLFKYRLNFKVNAASPLINNGLATALEVLLCAEVLKTLVARNISQLIEVGLLIVIRIGITVLVHWELAHANKQVELKIKQDKYYSDQKSHRSDSAD